MSQVYEKLHCGERIKFLQSREVMGAGNTIVRRINMSNQNYGNRRVRRGNQAEDIKKKASALLVQHRSL